MLYFRWIEGLRGIRHSNRTQSRLTRTVGSLAPVAHEQEDRAATARRDLAARLRPLQAALKRRLARADVLADMIRAVNASLDPSASRRRCVSRVSGLDSGARLARAGRRRRRADAADGRARADAAARVGGARGRRAG